jgi:hypothetical protein
MKTNKLIPCLFLVASSLTFSSVNATNDLPVSISAQKGPGDGFTRMNAHRLKNSAVVTWSLSTQNVTGFIIQKSWDGQYFDNVGTVPPSGSRSNSFNDENAFPGNNFYRVIAQMEDGSSVTSEVQVVKIMRRG